MTLFIRADASVEIGSGHVMRCLTLADELRQDGAAVSFLCCEEQGNLLDLITSRGYPVHPLPSGIDPGADQKLVQSILRQQRTVPDWLIVDHYERDASYETPLRQVVSHIMVIDDLANRPHDCDLLLDQNYHPHQDRYHGLVPPQCVQLLGVEYVLLRPQFRRMREQMLRKHNGVGRMLIFMSGSDPTDETRKVLRSLQQFQDFEGTIDVVIGPSNPFRDEIERLASHIPAAICHVNVENMAELMGAADLAIGAGGTSTWERCCLGLPSIVIMLADNQREIVEHLDKTGIVTNLGWHAHVTVHDIKRAITRLIADSRRREMIGRKSQALVDGKGTERVREAMRRVMQR